MNRSEVEATFRQYGPVVMRRACAILGNLDEAKDALQEVFIKALVSKDAFRAECSATTWIYRITTNVCLNILRARKRRNLLHAASAEHQAEFAAACGASVDIHQRLLLQRVLAEADDVSAQAAIYVYVDGMSRAEAASVLGVSPRTVGNFLRRFQQSSSVFLQQVSRSAPNERSSLDASERLGGAFAEESSS